MLFSPHEFSACMYLFCIPTPPLLCDRVGAGGVESDSFRNRLQGCRGYVWDERHHG